MSALPKSINENDSSSPVNHRANAQNFTLRSQQAQEVLSTRPGFLRQWALLIFAFILVFVVAGSWMIKYPDVIRAHATLTAANAPKELIVRQDGLLEKLFVNNDDHVLAGQPLAWIESTADHRQVMQLSALLSQAQRSLATNRLEEVSDLFARPLSSLGELQPAYQQFIAAWQQFNDYLVDGYYYKKKIALLRDAQLLQKIHATLIQDKQLAQQDIDLASEASSAIDSLYMQKVISRQDHRDQESKLLGKKMSIPQLSSALLNNQLAQIDKRKDIEDLDHSVSQQKLIFSQALGTLKSSVDDWARKYIISASVDGKVVFIVPLQEKQFLQSSKLIGYLNPANSRYYAQVILPQDNFGKLQVGELVQLRFDAYPYQEFGYVPGRLSYISKIPSDSGFLANVDLPNGLVTNYRHDIQYRSGLTSQALVITKDSRLLQRFFYGLIKNTQQ